MSKRGTLIGQTILVNVFLVTAVLFGATSAANLDLRVQEQRVQFGLLALAIMLALLANIMMVRRRFSPLEELIEISPSPRRQPGRGSGRGAGGGIVSTLREEGGSGRKIDQLPFSRRSNPRARPPRRAA